jgi:predicted aspartyl protease
MDIDETVEFMVDTGASRTTLLDKDAIYLDLDFDKLPKYKENLSGIGGSINTYVIEDASLIIGNTQIDIPVMVGKHPLEKMTHEELIKTLRIPSLLGRDIINRFRLIFDKEKEELTLG